jgi:hypothetical protein
MLALHKLSGKYALKIYQMVNKPSFSAGIWN